MSEAGDLRRLAEQATPGPWRLGETPGGEEVWANRDPAGWDARMVATTATRLNRHPGVHGHLDAAFIAAANPTAVLALLDERDALRAQVKRVRARMDELAADQREALDHAGTFESHLVAAINLYSDACNDLRAALDGPQ